MAISEYALPLKATPDVVAEFENTKLWERPNLQPLESTSKLQIITINFG